MRLDADTRPAIPLDLPEPPPQPGEVCDKLLCLAAYVAVVVLALVTGSVL